MILKSIIRFYFLDTALDTLFDKMRWNLVTFSKSNKYPRSRYGVLQAARDEMFPTVSGSHFPEEQVEHYIDTYGVEDCIVTLTHFCALSGVHVSDFIMDQ